MKRLYSALFFFAVLLTAISTVYAFSAYYMHNESSSFLKEMDFILRSEWENAEEMVVCEVLLNPNAKTLPSKSRMSLVLTDGHGWNFQILRSDHSLGYFTSCTEEGFEQGKFTKRFGFRFYIEPELIEQAYLKFWFTGKDQNGKDQTGYHILDLQNFVPDYTVMKAAEQSPNSSSGALTNKATVMFVGMLKMSDGSPRAMVKINGKTFSKAIGDKILDLEFVGYESDQPPHDKTIRIKLDWIIILKRGNMTVKLTEDVKYDATKDVGEWHISKLPISQQKKTIQPAPSRPDKTQSDTAAAAHPIQTEFLLSEKESDQILAERKGLIPIAQFKTKDKLIITRLEDKEMRYTIKSEDGKVLAENLTDLEVYAKFPELSEIVERGIADWAGMDEPEITVDP